MTSRVVRIALLLLLAGSCAACTRAVFWAANVPALGATRLTGLEWGPGERGRFDLYPQSSATTAASPPLVVFLYGGNFTGGRRGDYRFVGSAIARLGFTTAIPDYRLYPEVRFPSFIEDAARAVVASQRVAAVHGADPRRVILIGHSAGAYIAAMLALEPRYLREAGGNRDDVVGWIGLSGPYDIEPNSDELRDVFDSQATPDLYRPLRRAADRSPPALLLHGADDDVVGAFHSQRLAARLESLRVPVTLQLYPDRGHADTVASLSVLARRRTDALARISAFLSSRDAATRPASSPAPSPSSR